MKTVTLIALCLFASGCKTDGAATITPSAGEVASSPASRSAVPGPEVVNGDTCVDDAWLLTHYDVKRLASGSSPAPLSQGSTEPATGYPIECCANGVLGADDDWRCGHDWPSSDVVDCSLWREYHDALAAAHPVGARSARVKANLATLKAWFTDGHNCMAEPPG